MSYYAQQNAKNQVAHQMKRKHGYAFGATPHLSLIGIGYGKVVVVVEDDHPDHDFIPTELDNASGFPGLPVDIEYGGLYPLIDFDDGYQRRGGGGGGGGLTGGSRVTCGQTMGTVMGVFNGVQNKQNKYCVISSHVSNNGKARCNGLGNMFKDAGCGKVFFEGTAYSVGANTSQSIKGLGVPKGIMKPTIGMACNMNAQTTGSMKGKVTGINFNAPRSVRLGFGGGYSCAVQIQDMFQSKPCPTHGDSGGAFWNDQGYILGLVTYGSTDKGGKNDRNCIAYNPSAIHMPQALGVTIGEVSQAGTITDTSPQNIKRQIRGAQPKQAPSNLNPETQQRGGRRNQGGFELPSIDDLGTWLDQFLHPDLAYGYGRYFAANSCIMKGIIWYQNKILDTGTPQGGPAYRGAPAPFYNMIQLYQSHNLVIGPNGTYLYPASNNKAVGPGQKLNDCRNGPLTKPAKGCSPSLRMNSSSNCSSGDRFINAKMKTKSGNWISWRCMIDSGASFMMCNASQMKSLGLQAARDNCDLKYTAMVPMIVPPAKKEIQMAVGTRDYGQKNFTPTSPVIMSEAVTIAITKDYTILVANDGSGALTYKCGGSSATQGDSLNGAWQQASGSRRAFEQEYETYYGLALSGLV